MGMTSKTITCPISERSMEPVFKEIILRKYDVTYYYSECSGLLKTEPPYWLDEAYTDAISIADTGIVLRNIKNSYLSSVILDNLSLSNGRILDLAGGYGMLTRLMRDYGFDCHTLDKYCENIFARKFEPCADFTADAIFLFEVLEHLDNPLDYLRNIFDLYDCKTLIFSTLTFAGCVPDRDWWYYAFETGQHISFYQPRTLAFLAKLLDCNYYQIDSSYHIITDRPIARAKILLCRYHVFRLPYFLYVLLKNRKLRKTESDHILMKNTR